MNVDPHGWCTPAPGQGVDAFLDEFVASRAPLTGAEITGLRAIFRPALAEVAQRAACGADADAA
ncbi:hypothetical protein [Kitasatospora sp. A2-31]|uniref:hypothetical protein n=1 Tax=Kitasatospora sp. A2-31 TaxID=2916414 RepID=UPI001EE9FE9A|nr:hypothetical protein [Kitasatospora sp. A2-31]MCG6496619.1 hypothetical protein [Kitasatospora sp. A2-31]